MTDNATLQSRRQTALPRGIGTAFPIFAQRAEGSELWDVEGNRYIDFAAGIAVLNTGHRHPKVMEAVRAQLDGFTHTAFQIVPYEPYVAVCERLNALAPFSGPAKSILFSTGAEAVENAIKIARAHTGRPGVVAFSGAFHGRTTFTMALTGKVAPYKKKFGIAPPGVFHVPFPAESHGVTVAESLRALETLFRADIDPTDVAAIIIEPVQGEGGFLPAPTELLVALREIADKHGIVLIADEIQTGFARTGKMFGIEHSGVEPDLVTIAKALAGGFPLSGVIGRAEIMDAPETGGLGGTYAGSPVACAAALAVLDVIAEESSSIAPMPSAARSRPRWKGISPQRHCADRLCPRPRLDGRLRYRLAHRWWPRCGDYKESDPGSSRRWPDPSLLRHPRQYHSPP